MTETGKPKKPRHAGAKSKSCCGTLIYLAECRGTAKKSDMPRWTAPPDSINKIVRKHPAS
jgi:hypothetical protein